MQHDSEDRDAIFERIQRDVDRDRVREPGSGCSRCCRHRRIPPVIVVAVAARTHGGVLCGQDTQNRIDGQAFDPREEGIPTQ